MISTAQLLCVHFMVGMSLLQSHVICVMHSNPFYCDTDCKADRGLKEMAGARAGTYFRQKHDNFELR